MINANIEAIPNELFNNYLEFLISKIYKILCMREENDLTLPKYMQSLQRELIGNKELIISLKFDSNFLSLLGKLEYLISNEVSIKTYKKDIFDCISLIKKMKEKYFQKED